MADEIPQWAIERALLLTHGEDGAVDEGYDADAVKANRVGFPTTLAFARYIAAHEEPPVDPLWAEAMTFTSDRGWNGDSPILPMVKFAHAAIRRGIEIERERQS